MRARQLIIWSLALGFLVWLPTVASAQNRSLSGKHKMFCCNKIPPAPIFNQPAFGVPAGYWTAYYTNLGLSPVAAKYAGAGLVKIDPTLVSAKGASYKTLVLQQSQIVGVGTNSMATPNTPKFRSLQTVLNWKNASATLSPGGSWPTGMGPLGGNFAKAQTWSFCPAAIGPGTPGSQGCAAPSSAGITVTTSLGGTTISHTGYRNGRILRKAGPNKFGGTMSLLGGNLTHLKRNLISPLIPVYLVGSNIIKNTPIGGAIGTKNGVGFVSNTTTTWPLYVGPLTKVHTPGSGYYYFPTATYVPNPAVMQFVGAGPWGTGYVNIQITQNQQPPLTKLSWALTGYDNRNASGVGNLQLVSGVMYNGLNVKGSVTLGNALTLTLPEPAPALGVAAGAFALAGLGWLRVRRQRQS